MLLSDDVPHNKDAFGVAAWKAGQIASIWQHLVQKIDQFAQHSHPFQCIWRSSNTTPSSPSSCHKLLRSFVQAALRRTLKACNKNSGVAGSGWMQCTPTEKRHRIPLCRNKNTARPLRKPSMRLPLVDLQRVDLQHLHIENIGSTEGEI